MAASDVGAPLARHARTYARMNANWKHTPRGVSFQLAKSPLAKISTLSSGKKLDVSSIAIETVTVFLDNRRLQKSLVLDE